jgi:hypothetical protein
MRMGRLEFVGHRKVFVRHIIPLAMMVMVRMVSAKNPEKSTP